MVKCFRAQFNVITFDRGQVRSRQSITDLHWMLLHLDLRSNHYEFRLSQVYVIGSELKFYNLHQTLNISINVLKSFTDIYCISSAKSGFVFFISFTSFFLTFISYNNLFTKSCQACRLTLVARAPNPPTHL